MGNIKRSIIRLLGIVQGVGFRPFAYRTANLYGLKGCAYNKGSSLVIELEGGEEDIDAFLKTVVSCPPVQARIEKVEICSSSYIGYDDFTICNSSTDENHAGFISPDIAVCNKCLDDIKRNVSRRYRYALTNCTDCGPRYSVVQSLPYDRESTTMSVFKMCSVCEKEYSNPSDRRFHAQTNCCSKCGPHLTLLDENGNVLNSCDPIEPAVRIIKQGKIVAIKGIGGYHLCCNAQNEDAVKQLRLRKRRPDKPLAVMARDIESVRKVCRLSGGDEEALTDRRKPIVLAQKAEQYYLSDNIAPGQTRLGIMLPYTPLHVLLFDEDLEFLVMTSGNISGTPICYKEPDAFERLKGVADFYLIHNREINTPVDDSVVRVVDSGKMVSRCGRGYAPATFPIKSQEEILALGSEQKSSVCLLQNGYAHMSQYLGDLKDLDTYNVFRGVVENLRKLFKANPTVFAHDLNPDFLSTRYAVMQEGIKVPVQHHHAHMASCMAEHNLHKEVIGVIFDGTGMGTDGAVWGGEFLAGLRSGYQRAGQLKYVTLQGGDSVVKEPWKSAVCYLNSIGIEPRDFLHGIEPVRIDTTIKAIKNGLNCCKSSSMGRLFDCVAALIGLRLYTTYDAQASIELESIADESVSGFYDYTVVDSPDGIILEFDSILMGIIRDLSKAVSLPYISAKFHNTIVHASVECVCKISRMTGIRDIVLGGGTFENMYILKFMVKSLKDLGFNVYYNMKVPVNDGGISLGQAAVAAQLVQNKF